MSLLAMTLTAAHPVLENAAHVLSAAGQGGQGGQGGSGLGGIDSAPIIPPGLQAPMQRVVGVFKWGGMAMCAIALIVLFAVTAWNRKHGRGGEDSAGTFLIVIICAIGVSGALSILGFIIG